jgi:hypothetical protein
MAPHIILSLPHCHETATSSFFQPTMEQKNFESPFGLTPSSAQRQLWPDTHLGPEILWPKTTFGPTYYFLSTTQPRNSHKRLLSTHYGTKTFLNSHLHFFQPIAQIGRNFMLQGVLTFRDLTIRDPCKFAIYFQGLNL